MNALQKAAVFALLAAWSSQAIAQAYPSQTVRLTNPYADAPLPIGGDRRLGCCSV